MLSGKGSRQLNQNEVTTDGEVKVAVGQLTGRGNRRLAVIDDVICQERKFSSIGGTQGKPIWLVIELTDVKEQNHFIL